MARILMVEDNDLVAEVFGTALSDAGHDIDHSVTPQGAVHRITRNKYDLVLMDLGLPSYDGDQLSVELRELGYTGPIIVITGGVIPVDPELLRRANFTAVIRKPIKPADLLKWLDVYLKQPHDE